MKPITPERRIQHLQQLAAGFSTYLKTTPGTILTPELRLGVAICARDALLKCKSGCHRELKQEVCLRPGTSFYAYCRDMQHEPPFPTPPKSSHRKSAIDYCLLNIVHAVICHQNRLDEIWYKDALAALKSCGILDEYANQLKCVDVEDEMHLASHAAFCEIVLLAAVSHGLHSTFLSLGSLLVHDDMIVPSSLPSWEEMEGAPEPSNIQFSSLLHRVRSKGPFDSHAPCFYRSDLNKHSPEYAKVEKEVWEKIPNRPTPDICTSFSPRDNVMFMQFLGAMYLTPLEILLDWSELNSAKHCSSVTRFDLETIAGAVAAEHKCDY